MQNIIETIRKYGMIRDGMRVLAGVSGGADSVCLLAALLEFRRECPFTVTVVHVEHGIRGDESCQDAEFVQKLCAGFEVECRVVHIDAPGEAKARGISLEEAARSLRYQVFEQIRREMGADVIAVAHNENDQAETVLWNLIRGSALKGMGGIRPVRDHIIRPLLFTSRERIEQILRERGIGWRTDRTNLDVEYTRNRLRLEVLPYLEQHLNKKAAEHIAGTAEQLQDAQNYIENQVRRAAERCITDTYGETKRVSSGQKRCSAIPEETEHAEPRQKTDSAGHSGKIFLDLERFAQEEYYLQGEILRECISRCSGGTGLKDIGKVHIEMLRKLAELPCGKRQNLPGGIVASRQDGVILFEKRAAASVSSGVSEEEYFLALNGSVKIGEMTVTTRTVPRELFDRKFPGLFSGKEKNPSEILSEKKYTKWLSCDTIKSNVCCRKRKTGDYLAVNAQGGKKKLKDYMIDCKIPREERDSLWLFADGSHVLWLPGFRISETAKVTDETETILEITVDGL